MSIFKHGQSDLLLLCSIITSRTSIAFQFQLGITIRLILLLCLLETIDNVHLGFFDRHHVSHILFTVTVYFTFSICLY